MPLKILVSDWLVSIISNKGVPHLISIFFSVNILGLLVMYYLLLEIYFSLLNQKGII